METFAWRDNVFIPFCQQGGLPVALALFVVRDATVYTLLYIERTQRGSVVGVFAMWDSLAGGLPVGGVLLALPPYSAASTRVLSAKYDSGLRTAPLRFPHFPALPCGRKNCVSPSGSSFFRGGRIFVIGQAGGRVVFLSAPGPVPVQKFSGGRPFSRRF